MKDYLVWEAQGMRPNLIIEDCELVPEFEKILKDEFSIELDA